MIEIGNYSTLKVTKILDFGAYLDTGDNEVLLPIKEVPKDTKVGDDLRVFIYKDSENRLIASTRTPKIKINEFSCLEVKDTNKYGAFVDWGMDNQLLVPFREQPHPLKKGKSYVAMLYLDHVSDRLVATTKIDKHLIHEAENINEGDEVALLIYGEIDIAFKVIINQKFAGLLYKNEVYQPVRIGDSLTGFVKKIRDDRKIDVTLRQTGMDEIQKSKDTILQTLNENKGFLPLTDKSDPEEIKRSLHMSKKTFKMCIGIMYKERVIVLGADGIRLAGK
ncbi:MAG TPA: GntR family transcriptional regulator [Candidatus Margulisbacteria bacterium]|nr:MAG: GntR family transcriptional regulator [Candidatus Margulisbacteria bacterium GWD2_39_127]HAR63249.1 GntR family transcriptional regulator [Candidatus Margulisiibacteriota bacterium]